MARKRSTDMLNIFAIDPSKRACGIASLDGNNKEIFAKTIKSNTRNLEISISEIYNKILQHYIVIPDIFIIEKPIILPGWSNNKINDIIKLAVSYGAYLSIGFEDSILIRFWTPTAPEWKGQQPKAVTHKRAYKALKSAGIEIVSENLDHNAKDAIALIATYLQKEGYID